jgi:hypothetical protein
MCLVLFLLADTPPPAYMPPDDQMAPDNSQPMDTSSNMIPQTMPSISSRGESSALLSLVGIMFSSFNILATFLYFFAVLGIQPRASYSR